MERTIKNGQSRETGNIGHTRHRMKTNKKNVTQHKKEKVSNTDPHQKHNTENKKDEQHLPHQKHNTENKKDEQHGPHQKHNTEN